jgi:hypothetical protein
MWSAATEAAAVLWSLKTQTASALRPRAGAVYLLVLETEVEPVENPIDETTTVAAMLRR